MPTQLKRTDLKPGPGIYYGSTVLKSLLGDTMPGIDLLVREAIQNSLDATIPGKPEVLVEFKFSSFKVKSFEGILDKRTLNRLQIVHGDANLKALYIRDNGTSGLDGPSSFADTKGGGYGNFLKLVMSVGLPQTTAGAGGAYGYGKSVYYRISHGPVMFYSRFRTGNTFHERLIFCLIENENERDESILENGSGLGWWGVRELKGASIPCEDKRTVASILKRLNLPRYVDEETGTLIFMPCLRPRQIPHPDEIEGTESGQEVPHWIARNGDETIDVLSKYTRVAVQRWYAPRLNNVDYPFPPRLEVSVNGQAIKDKDFLPLFALIQNLYRIGTEQQCANEALNESVTVIELEVRKVFKGAASPGKLVVLRAKKEHTVFGMGPPENHSLPHVQAYNFWRNDDETQPPILAMTRRPGMIVSYESDGTWVDKIDRDPHGKLLIALFILRTGAPLVDKFPNDELEEYIRLNEPPAHNRWLDRNHGGVQLDFIPKLQRNIAVRINSAFAGPAPSDGPVTMSALAEAVASRLLPAGFGSSGGVPNSDKEGQKVVETTGANRTSKPWLSVDETTYGVDLMQVVVSFGAGESRTSEISLHVSSDRGTISRTVWAKEVGGVFPFSIYALEDIQMKKGGAKGRAASWSCFSCEHGKSIEAGHEGTFENVWVSVAEESIKILIPDARTTIKVMILIKINRDGFAPTIEIREGTGSTERKA